MSQQNGSLTGQGGWLRIDNEGAVAFGRLVAVAQIESAPIKRLIQATQPSHVVILTGGRKRQTVLVLDSGHLIVSPLTVAEVLVELDEYHQRLVLLQR